MNNRIKSLLPSLFYGLGYGVMLLSVGLNNVAKSIVGVSIDLHILFNTEKGKKYIQIKKSIEEAAQALNKFVAAVQQQQQTAPPSDDSKLADIINQKLPANVLTLGKKKDEPTES